MNIRDEIHGACRHKPKFHRFIKDHGTDEGLFYCMPVNKRVRPSLNSMSTSSTEMVSTDGSAELPGIEKPDYSPENMTTVRSNLSMQCEEPSFTDV